MQQVTTLFRFSICSIQKPIAQIVHLVPLAFVRLHYHRHFADKWFQQDEAKCVVCFEDVRLVDLFGLECGHSSFHSTCLAQWIAKSATCPLCRRAVSSTVEIQAMTQAQQSHLHPPIVEDTYFDATLQLTILSLLSPLHEMVADINTEDQLINADHELADIARLINGGPSVWAL